jgi:hypothetical protein
VHPTIDEQLAGAHRLLDLAADDPGMPVGSAELLINVRRLLTQVRRSWSALPKFHKADNERLIALLTSTSDALTGPAVERINVALADLRSPAGDPAEEAQRNAHLRDLLTQVIRELSHSDEGHTAARDSIAQYLRDRLVADPS